jgi:hypothetical protein
LVAVASPARLATIDASSEVTKIKKALRPLIWSRERQDPLGWATPVLFMRSTNGTIFDR